MSEKEKEERRRLSFIPDPGPEGDDSGFAEIEDNRVKWEQLVWAMARTQLMQLDAIVRAGELEGITAHVTKEVHADLVEKMKAIDPNEVEYLINLDCDQGEEESPGEVKPRPDGYSLDDEAQKKWKQSTGPGWLGCGVCGGHVDYDDAKCCQICKEAVHPDCMAVKEGPGRHCMRCSKDPKYCTCDDPDGDDCPVHWRVCRGDAKETQ